MLKKKLFFYELKLLKLNRPELVWIGFGCFLQLLNGMIMPLTCIIFSEIYNLFQLNDLTKQRRLSIYFMLGIFGVALLSLFCNVINYYIFAFTGSRLTRRIKVQMFQSILRQEMSFHVSFKNLDL